MTAAAVKLEPVPPHDHACGHCRGTGRKPLRPHLVETLAAVPYGDEVPTVVVAHALDLPHSTAINRLHRLERLGLLACRRQNDETGTTCWWRRA